MNGPRKNPAARAVRGKMTREGADRPAGNGYLFFRAAFRPDNEGMTGESGQWGAGEKERVCGLRQQLLLVCCPASQSVMLQQFELERAQSPRLHIVSTGTLRDQRKDWGLSGTWRRLWPGGGGVEAHTSG